MKSSIRTPLYITLASLSVAAFGGLYGHFVDHLSSDDLSYRIAGTAMGNVFPLMFGHQFGLAYGRNKKPLVGALWSGMIWFFVLLSIGLAVSPASAFSYVPTAIFGALATALLVRITLNADASSSAGKVGSEDTGPARSKSFKFEQADSSGLIREVEVMVIPKKEDITITLPLSKERQERESLSEQVNALITSLYEEKRKRFNATNPTAGEEQIVGKEIDKEKDEALKNAAKFTNATLATILATFTNDPASLRELDNVLDGTKYRDQIAIRELSTFYEVAQGAAYYSIKPHLDNLRLCHPMFAREDLSELEGDELEAARKVLTLSLKYGARAEKRESNQPYTTGEFKHELDRARSTIRKATPYMTPALTDVVLNHPDKLDQVKEMIAKRSIPVHEADSLIEEIVNVSTPLSDGAL